MATRAPAQSTVPWPSSFPAATPSPAEALRGTITASRPGEAQMQTANGPLTLKLHAGTAILNPKLLGYTWPFLGAAFEGVKVGQRVYAIGFPQSDGSLLTSEIDIAEPILPSSIIPTAAPTAVPTPAPAKT